MGAHCGKGSDSNVAQIISEGYVLPCSGELPLYCAEEKGPRATKVTFGWLSEPGTTDAFVGTLSEIPIEKVRA